MKKIIAFFTGIFILIPSFISPFTIYGANIATKFEISAPSIVGVNSPFSISVKALDSNNQLATDYRGSIIFSTDWLSDTLPMPGRPIVFTEEDQGEKFFPNGITFKKEGKNKIYVTDIYADIVGEVEILVSSGVVNLNNTIKAEKNSNQYNYSKENSNQNSIQNSNQNSIQNSNQYNYSKENSNKYNYSDMSIWQKIHCSIEQKGFKWAGVEKNFMNCGGSNILRNQNLLNSNINFGGIYTANFGNNFNQNIINETKQLDLAEVYKNFRIEIEKIFETNNNVDKIDLIQTKEQAIIALKKFDTAISNAKTLPKNIFFTEYPSFIKIYYKFFANENMSDFAQNENIEFLKEYSKIVAGKNRDDIGFVTSYAPNFNYIFPFGNEKIATENDRINIGFDIFTVDGNKLNWNDLEVDLNYKEKFYSAKSKQNGYFRFVLIGLDKTKKYDFSVSIKKPNSNTVLNKDFSFEFEKSKVTETILFYKLNNYEVGPWKIEVNNDVLDVGPINIVVAPYGDMLLYSAKKSSDNSSVDGIYLTENDKKPEYFLDSEKYGLYDFLKFYSKK